MPVTIDVSALPTPLALIVRPWAGVLETALPGMGDNVRLTAENASASLYRRAVMLRPIELGLGAAVATSMSFAIELDKPSPAPFEARSKALRALDALVVLLHDARPNARAMGLGLGW